MQKGREKFPLAVSLGYARERPGCTLSPRPGTTFGNLPQIPGTSQGYGVRIRPGSGLVPTITGIPNMGAHPHVPTLPRERTARLSSSDSKAIETLRPSSRENRVHARRRTTDDALMREGSKGMDRDPIPPPHRPALHPRRPVAQHLPPLPPATDVHVEPERDSHESGSGPEGSEETESSTEGSEILSEDSPEAPPSRPGFESDLEKSAQQFEIPFPDAINPSSPFPATIIQDHTQLNMERFAAGAHASGLSARVDNIVRAFRIHGPLDRGLLSKALDQVAGLHPLLAASFQRGKERLYLQTSQDNVSVDLTSPIIGHENPSDLIMNARRKIFRLQMRTDLCPNDSSLVGVGLSVVSLGSGELSDSPGETRRSTLPSPRKSVSFGLPPTSSPRAEHATTLPALGTQEETQEGATPGALMRARLVQKAPQEHILVLSFPRVICDFWSSCLFMLQLTEAYSKLEKSASYRPSLAAMRIETKRHGVMRAYAKEKAKRVVHHGGISGATRLLQKRVALSSSPAFIPASPARVHFQQVAHRENQLLKMVSKERLWAFWENMVTATIRRQRGPNRIKLVPPVRIPSGLGEKMPLRMRPPTSRLRPLTARNRPTTAARRQGSVLLEMGTTREALEGPPTLFHFIKVEEDVCGSFRFSLPEDYLASIDQDELLNLMCLGAYVLMLGRCCRGWGAKEGGRGEDIVGETKGNWEKSDSSRPEIPRTRQVKDPLQQYSTVLAQRQPQAHVAVASNSPGRRVTRKAMMGERLDLGSFLVGVEVSLRHSNPTITRGLFGPLTNNIGIRVNLSSCPTFADLVVSLWKVLQMARNHAHFPFSMVAEEVGLIHGLPVRYAFLYHRDVLQLTDPDNFYFTETAVGVRGHGLARIGSNCYLTPLSTKMDDSCHFELQLWEGYNRSSVGGGIRYQPRTIRTELVELFGSQLCRLLAMVAEDPCRPLMDLAHSISPPFLSSSRMRFRRRYH